MKILNGLTSLLKQAVDLQITTFSSGLQQAAMFVVAFDVLLIYILLLAGLQRKPGQHEALWVAVAALALAWVLSDAYVVVAGGG